MLITLFKPIIHYNVSSDINRRYQSIHMAQCLNALLKRYCNTFVPKNNCLRDGHGSEDIQL